MEINGQAGRVVREDMVRCYTFQARGQESAEVWQAGYFNDHERAFLQTFDWYVDDLLHAFTRQEAPPVHARAGQRALVLAHAAIQSWEIGRRVDV